MKTLNISYLFHWSIIIPNILHAHINAFVPGWHEFNIPSQYGSGTCIGNYPRRAKKSTKKNFLSLEDGTDRSFPNVGTELPLNAA